MEIVGVHDFGGNNRARDPHVLVMFHWSPKIKILEIHGHELSIWCGYHTVEETLGSGQVSSFGGDVARIVNAIATHGPAYSAGILFFWPMGGHNAKVCGFPTGRDFVEREKVDCVGTFDTLVPLSQTGNFLNVGLLPQMALARVGEFWVLRELSRVWVEGIPMECCFAAVSQA